MPNHPNNHPVLVRWSRFMVCGLGVSPAGFRRMLLQIVTGTTLLLWSTQSTWAACDLVAVNSVQATCSGSTTSQYGIGGETNGEITVSLGASIMVAGTYAIYFGSLTKVDNSGVINAINGTGAAYGVKAATFANITNGSGGTVSASSATNAALGVSSGTTISVSNSNMGVISAISTSGSAYGLTGATTTSVSNAGVISATSTSGSTFGMIASWGTNTINSNSSGAAIYGYSTNGRARGLYTYDEVANIIVTSNAGDIYAISASSTAIGVHAKGSSVAIGNNIGNILGTSTSNVAFGVSGLTGVTVSSNSGAIKGTSGTTHGYGI